MPEPHATTCPLAALRRRRKEEQALLEGRAYTPPRERPTSIEVFDVLVSQPPNSTLLGDHGHVYVAKHLNRCDTLESLSWALREAQHLIGGFVSVTYCLAGAAGNRNQQWTMSYGSREAQP